MDVPVISRFMPELVREVNPSRSALLQTVWRPGADQLNIEELLTELDEHIFEGRRYRGLDVPALREARAQLENAISELIAKRHMSYLRRHYGYPHFRTPYSYWARRQRLVKQFRRDHPGLAGEELFRAFAPQEARLREGQSLEETPWSQAMDAAIDLIFGRASLDVGALVRTFAAAAGKQRFAAWLTDLWPLLDAEHARVLGISVGRWNLATARACVAALLTTARAVGPRVGEGAVASLSSLIIELDSGSRSTPSFSRFELSERYANFFLTLIFPELIKSESWLRGTLRALVDAPSDTGVNSYALMSGMLAAEDTVITLNYDLLLEATVHGFGRLLSRVDYGIPQLLVVDPSDPHGPITSTGYGSQTLAILKLHGSVNWLQCMSCDSLYCFPDTPAPVTSTQRVLADVVDYYREKAKKAPCCFFFQPSRTRVPIVPPIRKRELALGPLASVWDEARNSIALADEIVFVGYGLAPADRDMRDLIESAFELRASGVADRIAARRNQDAPPAPSDSSARAPGSSPPSKRPVRILVVNRSGQPFRRYRGLFSRQPLAEMEAEVASASEYFRDRLLVALSSSTL